MIKFLDLTRRQKKYRKEIEKAIKRPLRRGFFILGPELEKFEKDFGAYLGGGEVVGVNSGTDALCLALKALGVNFGDEVITVANTATPTITAIRLAGAKPVFVDIDEKTLLMNPDLIEEKITPKTKVILPVHLFGQPVSMSKVLSIAKKYKLKVVEDCAQAAGAKYQGRLVGTLGDIGCFSFYPTKNLGALGDGGAIVTKNKKLAQVCRQLRNYGEAGKFNNVLEGCNSRLDEIQASFLGWSLGYLEDWNKTRRNLAKAYIDKLKDLPLVLPKQTEKNHESAWHLFVIRSRKRDLLAKYLADNGVATAIHYPRPVTSQPVYKFLKISKKELPITYKVSREILSLPFYPELKLQEVKKICCYIRKFYE
ncbi:MAG TPA: DegT/DnrJ/EryC1/StrS family aminotransferase [Candidatus Paceibacterota bacterium]|nr:DegT/DnrJ/EryC1/StrS family aminotransferase [Candidatus Paceibacterota bacterium]